MSTERHRLAQLCRGHIDSISGMLLILFYVIDNQTHCVGWQIVYWVVRVYDRNRERNENKYVKLEPSFSRLYESKYILLWWLSRPGEMSHKMTFILLSIEPIVYGKMNDAGNANSISNSWASLAGKRRHSLGWLVLTRKAEWIQRGHLVKVKWWNRACTRFEGNSGDMNLMMWQRPWKLVAWRACRKALRHVPVYLKCQCVLAPL